MSGLRVSCSRRGSSRHKPPTPLQTAVGARTGLKAMIRLSGARHAMGAADSGACHNLPMDDASRLAILVTGLAFALACVFGAVGDARQFLHDGRDQPTS